jgi:hypothetical protein
MKMKKWAPFTWIALLALASCEKEKSAQPCERTTAGISGSYKLQSLEYKMTPTSAPVDFMAFLDPCEKDDIIQLRNDGTWIYTDAGTVCAPAGTGNGTWTLNGNIITSDAVVNGTIQSYDCKTLVCYTENVTVPGDRFIQTLVKL